MRILIDCDDVVINLMDVWLELYNCDYNDSLKKQFIKTWDFAGYTKPECGVKIYNYLDDPLIDLYSVCEPIEGAKEAIDFLRSIGSEIVFSTRFDDNKKFKWLKDHGFTSDREEFVVAYNKNLIKADIIIDDNVDHISSFDGLRIIYSQPWNESYTDFDTETTGRADSWSDISKFFIEAIRQEVESVSKKKIKE